MNKSILLVGGFIVVIFFAVLYSINLVPYIISAAAVVVFIIVYAYVEVFRDIVKRKTVK